MSLYQPAGVRLDPRLPRVVLQYDRRAAHREARDGRLPEVQEEQQARIARPTVHRVARSHLRRHSLLLTVEVHVTIRNRRLGHARLYCLVHTL